MSAGRKLEFDKEVALEAAMIVFWKKGYAGASLTDLTSAMGINKSSLYASFGNKEAVFIQATDYYIQTIAKLHSDYLWDKNKPLRERIKNYLYSVLSKQREKNWPKGCYISLCTSESEGDYIPELAQAKVIEAQQYGLNDLVSLFTEDEEAKALHLNESSESNAHFVLAIMNGMATMARGGCCSADLDEVIERTLSGLGIP